MTRTPTRGSESDRWPGCDDGGTVLIRCTFCDADVLPSGIPEESIYLPEIGKVSACQRCAILVLLEIPCINGFKALTRDKSKNRSTVRRS